MALLDHCGRGQGFIARKRDLFAIVLHGHAFRGHALSIGVVEFHFVIAIIVIGRKTELRELLRGRGDAGFRYLTEGILLIDIRCGILRKRSRCSHYEGEAGKR